MASWTTRRGDASELSALQIERDDQAQAPYCTRLPEVQLRVMPTSLQRADRDAVHYPTDVVLLAVLWRLRYKLSFREGAELLLQRGYAVTYETVRAWEFRFAPLLTERLRGKRRGCAGVSWYLDETYVRVAGRRCYLYRAIDRDGELIDSMLSEHRDKHAARRFLRRLIDVTGRKPLRVTTDHHPPYRKAIRWILEEGAAPTQPVSEQPHRAGPSRRQAAVLPDAGLREVRVGSAILYRV